MRLSFMAFFIVLVTSASAQSILGKWKTIDDETGEARSIVEISESGPKVIGKIVKLFPRPNLEADPVCEKCDSSDPRYKKKIIGMEIIRNMEKDGAEYAGGDVLDPQNGKVYRAKIWLEGKDLKLRGYWGPFYRTQTWKRAD